MANPAIITRRSALVGAFSSLLIPPAALALIQPALAEQEPMTAYERANFHMAEFGKAMDEMLPASAHYWSASLYGAPGTALSASRHVTYKVPDPDLAARLGRDVLIERRAEFR